MTQHNPIKKNARNKYPAIIEPTAKETIHHAKLMNATKNNDNLINNPGHASRANNPTPLKRKENTPMIDATLTCGSKSDLVSSSVIADTPCANVKKIIVKIEDRSEW